MIGNGYGDSMFLATHGILARANAGTPPVNTVAPVISGTQVVGSSLSSTTGTWTGSPAPTFTYQWYRGATLISGATSSSYTLVQADAGNTSNITCQVTANNGIGSATATSNTLAQIFDFDANAFITAASITDSTQKSATNTLTIDLKGYNIWTKMKALYPFVGGTATSHSYNLRNTAQFQISWGGGVNHNSNGITGSINGFGNTGLIPSASLTNNSLNVTVYSRTNNVANATEIGCSTTSFLPIIGLGCRGLSDQIIFDGYDFTAHRLTPTNLDSRGFFHGNILTSTNQKVYKNGVQQASTTTAQTQTQPTVQPIYILARNDSGTAANYSNRNLAFSSIGDGLTDTEASNFYTAVQAFQTTLGRQV